MKHPAVLTVKLSPGRPRFYDLLRRCGQAVFYVFDCLSLDGRDLRARPQLDFTTITK